MLAHYFLLLLYISTKPNRINRFFKRIISFWTPFRNKEHIPSALDLPFSYVAWCLCYFFWISSVRNYVFALQMRWWRRTHISISSWDSMEFYRIWTPMWSNALEGRESGKNGEKLIILVICLVDRNAQPSSVVWNSHCAPLNAQVTMRECLLVPFLFSCCDLGVALKKPLK